MNSNSNLLVSNQRYAWLLCGCISVVFCKQHRHADFFKFCVVKKPFFVNMKAKAIITDRYSLVEKGIAKLFILQILNIYTKQKDSCYGESIMKYVSLFEDLIILVIYYIMLIYIAHYTLHLFYYIQFCRELCHP